MIPLSIPNFEGNEEKYVTKAVAEGWVSTGGAYITELEKVLSSYLGVEEVAACQSGTAGLHLSMVECGVKPGDHVIVPTLTFIAAVNPVRYQFADPIFMDCDDSLCMDPKKLASFLKMECEKTDKGTVYKATGRPIRAMVIVHVFGNLADMETIMALAAEYNIVVIEDATEALGSRYESGKYAGRYAGTIGDFGVYSFNGNKIITTGGGGAVTAKDPEKARHIRFLSTQAKTDAHNYIHDEVGFNYRMTNVQAAIGVAQMEYLEEFIRRKNKYYDLYKELLEDEPNVRLIPYREGTRSNKWLYAIDVDMDRIGLTTASFISKSEELGFQTRPIWGLIHEQKPYRDYVAYKMEKAPYFYKRVINIPCSTNITEDDVRFVAEKIKTIIKG
ncbi:MAG: LegC family aminotransferase [Lachnospiraceae bacterium]|nr:LegC family aminotransferase [Lachnospiraceae bacterium]